MTTRELLVENIRFDEYIPVFCLNKGWVAYMETQERLGDFVLIPDSSPEYRQTLLKLYRDHDRDDSYTDILLYKITEKGKEILTFYEL